VLLDESLSSLAVAGLDGTKDLRVLSDDDSRGFELWTQLLKTEP
jgi:hypothetical protein